MNIHIAIIIAVLGSDVAIIFIAFELGRREMRRRVLSGFDESFSRMQEQEKARNPVAAVLFPGFEHARRVLRAVARVS